MFIRGIDNNLNAFEELAGLQSIKDRTTGKDICIDIVDSVATKLQWRTKKQDFYILPNFQQQPTTFKLNYNYMFSRKANPLLLTQSKNYSFVAPVDKISSNNKKIYLIIFSNLLEVLKPSKQICMVSKKK